MKFTRIPRLRIMLLFRCGSLLLLVGGSTGCGSCENEVVAELPSASGAKAVVFTRSCGATTGVSTHISILTPGASLPNNAGNVFIADSDRGKATTGASGALRVEAKWAGANELRISYPKAARVFRSEQQIESIQVLYRKSAE